MAALQFQIHTDQENLGSHVTAPKGHQRTVSGIRGKTFQSGTPYVNPTPRKALGDVNCNRGPPLSGKPPAPLKPLANKSVTKKPVQNILKQSGLQKENKGLGVKVKHSSENRQSKHGQKEGNKKLKCSAPEVIHITAEQRLPPADVDEIEKMPVAPKTEDDFEDIWPKKERVSTYIEKLISWRPPCLFGVHAYSDEEEEEDGEKRLKEMMDLIDSLPKPAGIKDEYDISEEELQAPEFENVPLPSIDDLSFPFIDETVISQSLEDSFSVVPHLERLQINVDCLY
ncbi:uncharacterized protein LOC121384295 isoform X2 [Gigantopelta aegis]|nr:uncharacterized protein LOC121384295 isoform X2 [Gigantopelta aegis]XP_041370548.1 uncharacterized protein LOC121384295 isoform X2 [Gigantopelta aegis]